MVKMAGVIFHAALEQLKTKPVSGSSASARDRGTSPMRRLSSLT